MPRVQTVQLPGPQSRATRGTATAIQYVHKAMALGACAPKGTFVRGTCVSCKENGRTMGERKDGDETENKNGPGWYTVVVSKRMLRVRAKWGA